MRTKQQHSYSLLRLLEQTEYISLDGWIDG